MDCVREHQRRYVSSLTQENTRECVKSQMALAGLPSDVLTTWAAASYRCFLREEAVCGLSNFQPHITFHIYVLV